MFEIVTIIYGHPVLTQRIKSTNINKFYAAVKHTKPQTSMLLQNVYSKQQNFKVISN